MLPLLHSPILRSQVLPLLHSPILRSQGRRTYNVLPDGNCMFRALSLQLFGTDEFHGQLRQMLLAVIQSNHTIYEPYIRAGKIVEGLLFFLLVFFWSASMSSYLYEIEMWKSLEHFHPIPCSVMYTNVIIFKPHPLLFLEQPIRDRTKSTASYCNNYLFLFNVKIV